MIFSVAKRLALHCAAGGHRALNLLGEQAVDDDGRQGGNQHSSQQEQKEERRNENDFLQQLRLGLFSLDEEES